MRNKCNFQIKERVKIPEKSENGKTELTKLKGKMSTAKGKVIRVVNQLKILVPEFTKLAVDDADRELDKAA